YKQRVAGDSRGIDALTLGCGWDGEYLRRAEHLAEPLIFHEIERLAAAVVKFRQNDRTAVRNAELVAGERRNTARVDCAAVVEKVASVKRRVAHEFECASVNEIVTRFGNDIRKSGGSVADVSRHHSRTGLNFLDRIDVEVRKCRAAGFRVGRIDS